MPSVSLYLGQFFFCLMTSLSQVQLPLQQLSQWFARQFAQQLSNQTNLQQILSQAPNIVTQPLGYTIDNLRPFNVPVYVDPFSFNAEFSKCLFRAAAVDFVGLILLGWGGIIMTSICNNYDQRTAVHHTLVVRKKRWFPMVTAICFEKQCLHMFT